LSTMAAKNIKHEKLLQLIVKQLIDQWVLELGW
jgi:hypothetical protein